MTEFLFDRLQYEAQIYLRSLGIDHVRVDARLDQLQDCFELRCTQKYSAEKLRISITHEIVKTQNWPRMRSEIKVAIVQRPDFFRGYTLPDYAAVTHMWKGEYGLADPVEQRAREYFNLEANKPKPEPLKPAPRIDGLEHATIRSMFMHNQREGSEIYKKPFKLTPAQKEWARADWSAQVKAKTEATRKTDAERERNRVTVDHGDDE